MLAPVAFSDSKAVERQNGIESVLDGRSESGGDEKSADFVAVQADGVRLVVQAWAADVYCRRECQQSLLFGVSVETQRRCTGGGPPWLVLCLVLLGRGRST
jgi:hypothetical protein